MSRQEQLIEYITDDIVSFIMEDFKVPVLEAMQRLYTSETFSKLNNVETGLYLESSAYVYDIYKSEKISPVYAPSQAVGQCNTGDINYLTQFTT